MHNDCWRPSAAFTLDRDYSQRSSRAAGVTNCLEHDDTLEAAQRISTCV